MGNGLQDRSFEGLQLGQPLPGLDLLGDVHGIAQDGPAFLVEDKGDGFHYPPDPPVLRDDPELVGRGPLPVEKLVGVFLHHEAVFRVDEPHGVHSHEFLLAVPGVSGGVLVDELEDPVLDDVDPRLGTVGHGPVGLLGELSVRDVLEGDDDVLFLEAFADPGSVDEARDVAPVLPAAGELDAVGASVFQGGIEFPGDGLPILVAPVEDTGRGADQLLGPPAEDPFDTVIGKDDAAVLETDDGMGNGFQGLQLRQLVPGLDLLGDVHGVAHDGPAPLVADGGNDFGDPANVAVFGDGAELVRGGPVAPEHLDSRLADPFPVLRVDEARGFHADEFLPRVSPVIRRVLVDETELSVLDDVDARP